MDAQAFAQDWQDGWNSHDLGRIMAHYREDIVFRSNKALALVGQGELRGKSALRAYWAAALDRQPDLRFEVLDVFDGFGMLTLTYRNHRGMLAAETLYFDDTGIVYQAAACHRG
ncbi:YybH family protein [Tropicibacter sp. S64]|uniref:YybH family protein n=1 Tax=Tropicibacter sp. S64 TaxID=3415122 RepID=UPI003C7B4CE2